MSRSMAGFSLDAFWCGEPFAPSNSGRLAESRDKSGNHARTQGDLEPKRFGGATVISDRFNGRSSAAERVVASWTTNPGFKSRIRGEIQSSQL
jgi:hypothetical protein